MELVGLLRKELSLDNESRGAEAEGVANGSDRRAPRGVEGTENATELARDMDGVRVRGGGGGGAGGASDHPKKAVSIAI